MDNVMGNKPSTSTGQVANKGASNKGAPTQGLSGQVGSTQGLSGQPEPAQTQQGAPAKSSGSIFNYFKSKPPVEAIKQNGTFGGSRKKKMKRVKRNKTNKYKKYKK
jgi:hypothetical protein